MMQLYHEGEKVRYSKYKNKIAEIVFYIEGSEYGRERYAIKYLRGDFMINAVVEPQFLEKLDVEIEQLSIFNIIGI